MDKIINDLLDCPNLLLGVPLSSNISSLLAL